MSPAEFSVVILTLNEEAKLPRCLESVSECGDILVVDSGSTDRTVELARGAGARVLENPFTNFAQQRNHANRHGALKHPWVFHLDADETFTPALDDECRRWGDPDDLDGAWVAPQMMWRGTWVKRSTDYPAWQARFVHRDRFRFIEIGHGQREAPDMRMGRLTNHYRHDLSAEGVAGWVAKHRRYAEAEAEAFLRRTPPPLSDLWSAKPLHRRRALKHFSYHLPGRPLLRFIYQYMLRGGALDGRVAWEYCRLLAAYEGFTTRAIKARRQSRPTPGQAS